MHPDTIVDVSMHSYSNDINKNNHPLDSLRPVYEINCAIHLSDSYNFSKLSILDQYFP